MVGCCETNLRESHEIPSNQASNENGTRPETHAREEFSSSLPVLPSHGTHNLELYSTSNTVFNINSYRSLTKDPKSRTVKAKAHEREDSVTSLDDSSRRRASLATGCQIMDPLPGTEPGSHE